MNYLKLAELYDNLSNINGRLQKIGLIAEFLKTVPENLIYKTMLLLQGTVFPSYANQSLGIATQLMIKAIAKISGQSESTIQKLMIEQGDLGLVSLKIFQTQKQQSFFGKTLTIDDVFYQLTTLTGQTGKGSQDGKFLIIQDLLLNASPLEAKFLVRTILGQLRVGTAEGVLKESIVLGFLQQNLEDKEEKKKLLEIVEFASNIMPDFGQIALIAKTKGVEGLEKMQYELGTPTHVMLSIKAESIEELTEEFGEIAVEYKYDGMRTIVHKDGDKIRLFTRKLEDVTIQFPEIVEIIRNNVKMEKTVLEGEILAFDRKDGRPLPFQNLSQRIQRKYDIERLSQEIPAKLVLFDCLMSNSQMLISESFKTRRGELDKIIVRQQNLLELSDLIFEKDNETIKKFYQNALHEGHEGIMAKIPSSPYIFGRHVGSLYKIKPTMENLDLIVIGAYRGEGSRTQRLTSFELACLDTAGNYQTIGLMSTGFTEQEFSEITELLKPEIISQEKTYIKVNPKIIVEVSYQEIQESTNYSSGLALRFPAFLRFRFDKENPDTLERAKTLYKSQGRSG